MVGPLFHGFQHLTPCEVYCLAFFAQEMNQRFDSQFCRDERFSDIIISAACRGTNTCLEPILGRDENHRRVRMHRDLPQAPAELETVHARHVEIQDE